MMDVEKILKRWGTKLEEKKNNLRSWRVREAGRSAWGQG
jgi:hypothetical protein